MNFTLFTLKNPLKGAKLTYHTEGGNITQFFGENPELYAKSIPNYPPKMGHNGIDIALPYGTPILAAHDGVILGIAESTALGGNQIYLHSLDFMDGGITYKAITGYCHLSKILVKIGQRVKCGDQIGEEGNS
jgi:murein DD-endopeptidase MepM/ murein hydrolase activator NlpD